MFKIFKIFYFKFFFEESVLRILEEKGFMRFFLIIVVYYIIGSFFLVKVIEIFGIMINFVCFNYDLYCSFFFDGI